MKQVYEKRDIYLVQGVVKNIIFLLKNNKHNIVKELSQKNLTDFDIIIRNLQSIVKRELIVGINTSEGSQEDFEVDRIQILSRKVQKRGREDKNSLISGLGTYLIVMVSTFLISKVLIHYNYKVSHSFFRLLAY